MLDCGRSTTYIFCTFYNVVLPPLFNIQKKVFCLHFCAAVLVLFAVLFCHTCSTPDTPALSGTIREEKPNSLAAEDYQQFNDARLLMRISNTIQIHKQIQTNTVNEQQPHSYKQLKDDKMREMPQDVKYKYINIQAIISLFTEYMVFKEAIASNLYWIYLYWDLSGMNE